MSDGRRIGRQKEGKDRGFTLVELFVVLALIGTLASLAAFLYSRWVDNIVYRSTASHVFHLLREARSRAIATCLEHRVEFDSKNNRYRVTQGDRNINSGNWSTIVYDWAVCPPNVDLDANIDAIHLNPNGTANAGTISILDNTRKTRYEVKVARTGRIRIPFF
jgi:prepilin-type N-terminal cleavage/methylation domain-containing protein